MFDLKFDVKKFLAMPINAGDAYLEPCGSYGCLKGDFALCSNVLDFSKKQNVYFSFQLACSIVLDNKQYCYNRLEDWIRFSRTVSSSHLYNFDLLLSSILDRAENILILKKKPQYAKLFLVRALRYFKYIPQDAEIPIQSKTQLVEAI